jgi:hypothetical protein
MCCRQLSTRSRRYTVSASEAVPDWHLKRASLSSRAASERSRAASRLTVQIGSEIRPLALAETPCNDQQTAAPHTSGNRCTCATIDRRSLVSESRADCWSALNRPTKQYTSPTPTNFNAMVTVTTIPDHMSSRNAIYRTLAVSIYQASS